MGEAINLGKRGQTELVLTHFLTAASPQLMVLRNFEPAAGFAGLEFPNFIGSADFNGDGRTDIWESTDVEDRLKTFTNTPGGTLVPGAIDVCSRAGYPAHVLADFNGAAARTSSCSCRVLLIRTSPCGCCSATGRHR